MTETERSLLDAVLENPDDDLPRLVYADYLDENGDPKRAEFIRAQIAITHPVNDSEMDSPEYVETTKQFFSLEVDLLRTWLAPYRLSLLDLDEMAVVIEDSRLDCRFPSNYVTLTFRRGLISSMVVPGMWLLLNWQKLLAISFQRIDFTFDPYLNHGYVEFHRDRLSRTWQTTIIFDDQHRLTRDWDESRNWVAQFPDWLNSVWQNHPLYRRSEQILRPPPDVVLPYDATPPLGFLYPRRRSHRPAAGSSRPQHDGRE